MKKITKLIDLLTEREILLNSVEENFLSDEIKTALRRYANEQDDVSLVKEVALWYGGMGSFGRR